MTTPKNSLRIIARRAVGAFAADRSGLSALHYALLAGLIAVAIIPSLAKTGDAANGSLSHMANVVGREGDASAPAPMDGGASGGDPASNDAAAGGASGGGDPAADSGAGDAGDSASDPGAGSSNDPATGGDKKDKKKKKKKKKN